MNFDFVLTTHVLPLWFLVLALFLPRICLAVAWLQHNLVPFHLHGYIPLFLALLLPRVLVLVLIYQDQGFTVWFLVHVIALVLAWGGGGSRIVGRRRAEQYVE